MAFTLNRRLAQLIDSNGQLNTGKIPNDYITSDHVADNTITTAMLHTGFTVSTSNLSSIDTDDVSEGSSNLYYTNARADARIAAATTDDLTEGSTNLYYTDARVATYISGNRDYGNITTTGYIAGPATFTIDPAAVGDNTGTVVIAGNLQVDGTTTTINSTTMTVDDLNLTLASGAANAAAANGAGITVDGASATITYDGTNDEWDFNKPINVTGTVTADGLTLLQNEYIQIGGAGEFQIFNDGSNTVLRSSDNFLIQRDTSPRTSIKVTDSSGEVELSYAGSPKLATTSSGVNITGGLNASGSVKLDKSFASSDFLGDANIYSLRLTNDNTTAGNAVGLSFGHGGFNFTSFIASVRTGTGNNPKGDLVFGNRPSDGTAFVERMRIQANGHVGIATSNPTSKLSIVGGATSPGLSIKSGGNAGVDPFRVTWTNGTEGDMFIVDDNGNVGIGETSPGKLLHLKSGSINNAMVRIQSTGTNSYPGIQIINDAQTWEFSTHGAHSDALTFYNGTTHTFALATNGNVGIGVTEPSKALDISNTTSAKIHLQGGTNQNGISFAAAGNDGVLSSKYYLGVGSDLMSSTDKGAVLLDITNDRAVLLDDQSNSRLTFHGNKMAIDQNGNVGIGILSPTLVTGKIVHIHGGAAGVHLTDTASGTTSGDGAYFVFDHPNLYIQQKEAGPMIFETSGTERMRIAADGLATFTSTRNEWAMRLKSGSSRGGIVLDKPGTSTIMGSMLMLESDETFRLGTASNYHIRMTQNGSTFLGDTANTHFSGSGNLYMGTTTNFIAYNTVPGSQWTTIAESIGYGSQGYTSSQGYWHHLKSAGGTHITINTDSAVTASENTFDDFVVWQGTQDSGEPLFRVSNTGRVIAKQNYEIGNHKTNKEEFGVNAINTVDTATSNINTTTTNTYENRPGVYWLNYNSKRFRAFIKPNWLQSRNWVLAAKFFSHMDMPSGSSLWTNDASWNGGDFDLNNGHFSKYGNVWRYFGFNRLAMQMGDRVAPIMQFSSTQTLYGAFSGGRANNGGGVTPTSTDPALSTGAVYHTMTNHLGGTFDDLGGLEDKMQSYGLNKWANASTNSTSANNQGSRSLTAGGKGFELTVEDSHDNIGGNDSAGYAGAWIGCPLDEGNCNPLAASSNTGADSGFGFGGGCGNNARTWTSGIAEWSRGNEVANYHPAYIWLSID